MIEIRLSDQPVVIRCEPGKLIRVLGADTGTITVSAIDKASMTTHGNHRGKSITIATGLTIRYQRRKSKGGDKLQPVINNRITHTKIGIKTYGLGKSIATAVSIHMKDKGHAAITEHYLPTAMEVNELGYKLASELGIDYDPITD